MKRLLLVSMISFPAWAAEESIPTPEVVNRTYTKELTKLTEKPKSISANMAMLCVSIPDDKTYGPHSRHWVNHFRNELAMQKEGRFPPGSVLVKEKLNSPKEGEALVVTGLTGMIKQKPGTLPKSGDWLFFEVRNGELVEGKMESCVGCHSGAKRDFVFSEIPKTPPVQVPVR